MMFFVALPLKTTRNGNVDEIRSLEVD